MKMISCIYYVFLAGMFMACEKDPIMEPIPLEEDPIVEIQWASIMDINRSIVGSDQQQFYDGNFICFGDLDDPATIYGFDALTGDKNWEYLFEGSDQSNIDFNYRNDNILLARTANRVFGFDLNTRVLKWEVDMQSLGLILGRGEVASNGKYYQEADLGWQSGSQVQRLYEFDPFTGDYQIVFSELEDSLGTKSISPPAYTVDQKSGRELLIFNFRPNANTPPQETNQEIMAIDANTHEVVWRTLVTDSFASNGLHPPVIYEDLVITGGDWSIYAFDIHTGGQRWKYEEQSQFQFAQWATTNHLIHNDKLYVNETGDNISCLNPRTGELIWNNATAAPNCTDNMLYYEKEDLLVFTSWGFGSVMVLDALTGETIHREGPFEDSNFNNDIVYDPETDMFFTSTFKHAIGFTVERL